jgi:C-5 cytosine-specific DNA methylase
MLKKLKVLELFAGTRSISKAFEKAGHDTFSIDFDDQHADINWYTDIGNITAADILERFGSPDVIWCSPDCRTYSIAAISHHRTREENGNLAPKSEYAKTCDRVNLNMIRLIKELQPKYFFIENPVGGLRKMNFMSDFPRFTVWYCQYKDERAKPTDIFTNHPDPQFKPVCKNNNPNCNHERAKRGAKTGTQGRKGAVDRARIPEELCNHIVKICDDGEK